MTPAPNPLDHQSSLDGAELIDFDIRRYLRALRKYALPLIALVALAVTAAVVYTSRQTKIYESKASVQIEPKLPDLLGQGENGILGITTGIEYFKQQTKVLASFTLTRQTVIGHNLTDKLLTETERKGMSAPAQLELATQRLQKQMVVKYPDQDRIMYVFVRNPSAELAAEIANDHVKTYEAYAKGLLSTDTKQASKALQTEFEEAANKLQQSETDLLDFQKQNDIQTFSLEDRQRLASTNIATSTARLNEARGTRIELGAKLDRMKRAAGIEVLESPILMMGDSASFDTLRAQYYMERNVFLQLEKEVGPKNPEFTKQKAKMDDLYSALQSEAKRILAGVQELYEAALATERAHAGEVKQYGDEATALSQKTGDYNKLVRAKKTFEDKYGILRGRLSTSEMTGRMNTEIDTTYVKPLDEALVSLTPVSPSLRVNIAVATGLALALGLGLIFLSVYFDRTVKNTTDAQVAAGVPVLGFIPVLESGDDRARDLFVHENPKSLIAESCRALRTNIMFSAADRQLKTVAVCSANQREGKTTSVIYLGTTMAQSGKRVLLIDTDMRRPRLHSSLGISRQHGLTNLMLGDETYDEVIKPTDIPNLFMLPCGPLPPNPAELLLTKRFETVLADLSAKFDLIILDSPPVQAVTDAVVLSKLVDGVILVVRANKTLREDIRRSAKQIRDVGGSIFGLIVNEIDTGDRSYYSYGYAYGYGDKDVEPSV